MHVKTAGSILLFAFLGTSHLTAQTQLVGIWKEGDKFSYAIEDEYTLGPPGNASLSQSLKLDTEWQVKKVDADGSADIDVRRIQRGQASLPCPHSVVGYFLDQYWKEGYAEATQSR